MIEVKSLTKVFDNNIWAVDGISFTVEKGEIFGRAVTASIQGIILMIVAGLMGAFMPTIPLIAGALASVGVMLLITAGFVGLGVAFGSALSDFHAFQLLGTFMIWPIFMLSGVFFPIDVAPFPLQVAMLIDPLFHRVKLLRRCLLGAGTPLLDPLGWLFNLGVLLGFSAAMVGIGTNLFSRAQV